MWHVYMAVDIFTLGGRAHVLSEIANSQDPTTIVNYLES